MRDYFLKDTLISTDHHQEYKIQSFHSQQGLQSYDTETCFYHNGIIGSVDYERVFFYYEIICDDSKICVTENTKFRVGDEWIEAKNLLIGDMLKKMEDDSTISKKPITEINKIDEVVEVYGFINIEPNGVFFANRFMVLGNTIEM